MTSLPIELLLLSRTDRVNSFHSEYWKYITILYYYILAPLSAPENFTAVANNEESITISWMVSKTYLLVWLDEKHYHLLSFLVVSI